MFFLIFLELHLLDLCVDMAESFSKWLFNRSVWKIFLTCEEYMFLLAGNIMPGAEKL